LKVFQKVMRTLSNNSFPSHKIWDLLMNAEQQSKVALSMPAYYRFKKIITLECTIIINWCMPYNGCYI
jgi:hypothetical protein